MAKALTKAELYSLCESLKKENAALREAADSVAYLKKIVDSQAETIEAQKQAIAALQEQHGPPSLTSTPLTAAGESTPPVHGTMVYADGACIANGSADAPGGWGTIIVYPDGGKQELCGKERGTTNNRMELTAALKGLSTLPAGSSVTLVSDSQYVINGLQKGWARSWRRNGWYKSDGKQALNPDLWQELLSVTEKLNIKYQWIRGHNGHVYNERCDALAVAQAQEMEKEQIT